MEYTQQWENNFLNASVQDPNFKNNLKELLYYAGISSEAPTEKWTNDPSNPPNWKNENAMIAYYATPEGKRFVDGILSTSNNDTSTAGGMSYEEYLKNYGVDTNKAYSEAVRQANDDYYRSLMTYGKNAEALGGAGLVGAGVSNYGDAAAYAARQGAVSQAGEAKLEVDATQAASYGQYLQNLKAQAEADAKQAQVDRTNYITSLMSMGVDEATALSMLEQSGLFKNTADYSKAYSVIKNHYAAQLEEDRANYVNSLINMDIDETKALELLHGSDLFANADEVTIANAVASIKKHYEDINNEKNKKNEELAEEARLKFEEAIASGMTIDEAKAYINSTGKYNPVIDSIATTYSDILVNNYKRGMNEAGDDKYAAITDSDYNTKSGLDKLASMGSIEIGGEEYNEIYKNIQDNNKKSFEILIDDIRNEYKCDDVCEALGIAYDYDAPDESLEAAVKAIRERIAEKYENGDISEECYIGLLEKEFKYEIEAIKENGGYEIMRDVCGALVEINGRCGNENSYNSLVAIAAKELNKGGELAKKIIKDYSIDKLYNWAMPDAVDAVKRLVLDTKAIVTGNWDDLRVSQRFKQIKAIFCGIDRNEAKYFKLEGYSDEQMGVLYDIMTYDTKGE